MFAVGNPKTTVMKKFVFMLAVSIFVSGLVGHSQIRVGLAGGVSIAKMEGKFHGDGRAGLMASLVLDAPLSNYFSFYPTLSYVQKGVTEEHPAGTLIEKQYVALRYAEVSANFVYHVGGNAGTNFFLGLGPSLDLNLPSKRTSVTTGVKSDNDILFGQTAENDIKGVDYGVNAVLGWRSKSGFLLSLNYNRGLRNLSPETFTEDTRNQYIGIQLGIFLNNDKK